MARTAMMSTTQPSEPGVRTRPAASAARSAAVATTSPETIRALIVDDQQMACESLKRLLMQEPGIEVVGTCHSGEEALAALKQLSPDLVFLDVRMPGMSGFEFLARLDPAQVPLVVFVTASDDFAVEAFEVHALDYLVKPCNPERLRKTLDHVRHQIRHRHANQLGEHVAALLKDAPIAPKPPERLAIKTGGRVVLLKPDDISWVEADDNYVKLHVGQEALMARDTMNSIETRLPSAKFVRINRSTIVNLEKVRELQPLFHGEYAVLLRDGTRLTLTRNYRQQLDQFGLA